jgi:hypothetical protein
MRVRRTVAAVVCVGLLAVACGGDDRPAGISTGTALELPEGRNWRGIGALPPGYQVVLMAAFLWNASSAPIRLSEVSLTGTYSGSMTVVRTEVARLPGTHARHPPYDRTLGVVPGGVYLTYPPAMKEPGEPCHVQELHPVRGYELGPDQEARVLVWLRAASPGRFRIDGHLVVYEQGGRRYQQLLRTGLRGRVEEGAPRRALAEDPLEMDCAELPGVRALNER